MTGPELSKEVLTNSVELVYWMFITGLGLMVVFLMALGGIAWKLGKKAIDDFVEMVDRRFKKGEETMKALREDLDAQGDNLAELRTEHRLRHGGAPLGEHRRLGEELAHHHHREAEEVG